MSKQLLEAFRLAATAEKEGMRAYLNFAKNTKVDSGKNMFIQLALDEIDHLELIQTFIDKTFQGEEYTPAPVPAGRVSKFMPDVDDASRQKADKAHVEDEEALKIALEHEEKAKNFYTEQAGLTDNAEVKELFEKLAKVEQKHYDIIKAELDFIRQDGFWFDVMEFSLEKQQQ